MTRKTPKNAMMLSGELNDSLACNVYFSGLQPWQREAVRIMIGSISTYIASGGDITPLSNVSNVLDLIHRESEE